MAYVSNELLEIFPWLFNFGRKKDSLLKPVGSLHEIISLEFPGHFSVRVLEPKVLSLVP